MSGCDDNVEVASEIVMDSQRTYSRRRRNIDTRALVVQHNNKVGIQVCCLLIAAHYYTTLVRSSPFWTLDHWLSRLQGTTIDLYLLHVKLVISNLKSSGRKIALNHLNSVFAVFLEAHVDKNYPSMSNSITRKTLYEWTTKFLEVFHFSLDSVTMNEITLHFKVSQSQNSNFRSFLNHECFHNVWIVLANELVLYFIQVHPPCPAAVTPSHKCAKFPPLPQLINLFSGTAGHGHARLPVSRHVRDVRYEDLHEKDATFLRGGRLPWVQVPRSTTCHPQEVRLRTAGRLPGTKGAPGTSSRRAALLREESQLLCGGSRAQLGRDGRTTVCHRHGPATTGPLRRAVLQKGVLHSIRGENRGL